ncbi:hypothetical protein LTR53_013429 [Teratosphaeriaceae sp. CCFEE 6253]|nr:hypothetical protein LTR53_013429 [Teratosphaeriaceae sp. CCFEE 6253]
MAPITRANAHDATSSHHLFKEGRVVTSAAGTRKITRAIARRNQKAMDTILRSGWMSLRLKIAAVTATSRKALTAVSVVFATPKLLEKIIIQVNAKTSLLSQRVSRHWRQVVMGSHLLQKKLYLRSATFEEALELAQGEDESRALVLSDFWSHPFGVLNPLLFKDGRECTIDESSVLYFRTRIRAGLPVVHSRSRMQFVHPPMHLSTNAHAKALWVPHDDYAYNHLHAPPGMRVGQWQTRMKRQVRASEPELPFEDVYLVLYHDVVPLERYRENPEEHTYKPRQIERKIEKVLPEDDMWFE